MKRAVILGKENKGLYCMKRGECFQAAQHGLKDITVCFSVSELWHFRFGHLPFEQLQYVSIPHCNKARHGVCQICPKAKLHRNSFSLSNTRSLSYFQLIHVDIWGPYPHMAFNIF